MPDPVTRNCTCTTPDAGLSLQIIKQRPNFQISLLPDYPEPHCFKLH